MKVVTVKYQTKKHYCNCCGQIIVNPKMSETREFRFKKDDFLDWLSQENWQITATDKDELSRMIEEFVYETISFFATSSDETIHIDGSEFEQIKQFALDEVVS